MPILEPSADLIILSDLHLAGGPSLASGKTNTHELFVSDQAFAHFGETLIARRSPENQPGRLLFLGDFLDFLHAHADPPGKKYTLDIDSSEAAALHALERIFSGHPVFFEALNRLAAAGFQIDLVPGNHDIDLMRPAVQSRFTDLLSAAGGQANIASNVHFFPWIYTIPGILYAEHGNQYHEINSFPTLLMPYHHRHPENLELPLGSYFDKLIYHLVERVGGGDKTISSPIRYLAGKFFRRPSKLVLALPEILQFIGVAFRIAAYRSSPNCASKRRTYQAETLPRVAGSLGLSPETVRSLDRLTAAPNLRMAFRLLRKNRSPAGQADHGSYLFQAAQSIHQVLRSEGVSVPYYVFGHSHDTARLPIPSSDGPSAWYLNTGTWAEAPFSSAAVTRNSFPFIQVVKELNSQGSTATLLLWNESRRLIEPFDEST